MRKTRMAAPSVAWRDAFRVACATCELFPQDDIDTAHRFAAETVARAIFRAMRQRGIEVSWPTSMGYGGGVNLAGQGRA